MSEDYIARFVDVLNSTFSACDENKTGFVEINRLVNFLISQEPSWIDNEIIKEEFNSVLQGNLNNVISKEEFIKSLQGWFEASLYQYEKEKEKNVNDETGRCSSSTSGIGEPSEITSGDSTNSMEEMNCGTNFVSDGQTFTNEDLANEMSFNESTSSQSELRLVKVLQSEVSTLLRKNEYIEKVNESLHGQVSSLEDALAKKKEESEDYRKQLMKTNERLEIHIQNHKENEDRTIVFTEENRSMKKELAEFTRENTKLKALVSHIEEKLENSLSENFENITKLEKMTDKFNTVNDLYNNSLKILKQERESLMFKEKERENTLREITKENRSLKSQLESNASYIEDIKRKFNASLEELSVIKNSRIKNVMKIDDSSASLSPQCSEVFFNENITLESDIPFENSLLAELKGEVQPDKNECCCVCKQRVSLSPIPPFPDTADAAVGTNVIKTVEKATMTSFDKPRVLCLKKRILSKIGFYQRKRIELV